MHTTLTLMAGKSIECFNMIVVVLRTALSQHKSIAHFACAYLLQASQATFKLTFISVRITRMSTCSKKRVAYYYDEQIG